MDDAAKSREEAKRLIKILASDRYKPAELLGDGAEGFRSLYAQILHEDGDRAGARALIEGLTTPSLIVHASLDPRFRSYFPAGFDGRAYQMSELRDTIVFEIDHPDTQRDKRERARRLLPVAREIRHVPVDFTMDSLEDKLAAAGHDPEKPTTWVWEGV